MYKGYFSILNIGCFSISYLTQSSKVLCLLLLQILSHSFNESISFLNVNAFEISKIFNKLSKFSYVTLIRSKIYSLLVSFFIASSDSICTLSKNRSLAFFYSRGLRIVIANYFMSIWMDVVNIICRFSQLSVK